MKAELVPEGGGKAIAITKDVTVVGRREYCDVQVDHPSLSKRHCVLVKTDGLLVVRDLASTNGTKVKGQKIRWAALLPEDRIAFGQVKFRVYLGPDDVPSPSERGERKPAVSGSTRNAGSVAPALQGFPEPSPLQGMPVVAAARQAQLSTRLPEPLTALISPDDDLVLVEDDDEIIELG
ncbi:MAG: FHA domain-containing protein [Isosphaeraceae bacterium]|nr:FHA domain-containing protein [Isosphaeraceae bacterium]